MGKLSHIPIEAMPGWLIHNGMPLAFTPSGLYPEYLPFYTITQHNFHYTKVVLHATYAVAHIREITDEKIADSSAVARFKVYPFCKYPKANETANTI